MLKHRTIPTTVLSLALLAGAVILSLMLGSYRMSPAGVIQTLLGYGTKLQRFTIFEIRLPRTVLAILTASALGISGGVLQGITRNPLAEPGMTGINAGAALSVVLLISAGTGAYYDTLNLSTVLLMPVTAMAGGLATVLFLYVCSYKKGIRPVRFLLTGVGVNAGLSAVITFYQLNMSKGDYNQVLAWTNGSLWGSSRSDIALTFPPILILILVILAKSRTLDVLRPGDELAAGVGVSVQRERLFFLTAAALLAALATSVAGNIAFLGLLGPQIAGKLTGSGHLRMLPLAAVISSLLLVLSDTAARNLFAPLEIPVGIIVSVIGVPYFIYLMLKSKQEVS